MHKLSGLCNFFTDVTSYNNLRIVFTKLMFNIFIPQDNNEAIKPSNLSLK